MRIIKFRIFNKKIKSYIDIHSSAIMIDELNNLNDNLIVEQFTGLHDKNGKEIYEGDIILQKTNNGKKLYEVKFEFGCFYAGFHNGSSTKVSPKLIQKNAEVIGNIYENP